jgi:hypothetical protein
MIQCDKLLALGPAEKRDVLEKSGLCMFCLKHSAEFECYGRGGLSKPRCTRGGCDGEHTPDVHMLMSEDGAKVSLVAGDGGEDGFETEDEDGDECDHEGEYEWEYEDGGLWVGTVSAAEVLEWGRKAPVATSAATSAVSEGLPEEGEGNKPGERECDFQVEREPEEGAVEDGWWNLEMGSPDLEDVGVSTLQAGPSRCMPRRSLGFGHPAPAGEQWTRKRQEAVSDQEWEEARQHARLVQMSNSGFSSGDEDEGQLGGWRQESFEPP